MPATEVLCEVADLEGPAKTRFHSPPFLGAPPPLVVGKEPADDVSERRRRRHTLHRQLVIDRRTGSGPLTRSGHPMADEAGTFELPKSLRDLPWGQLRLTPRVLRDAFDEVGTTPGPGEERLQNGGFDAEWHLHGLVDSGT